MPNRSFLIGVYSRDSRVERFSFLHRAERQDDFAVQFVQHLCEAGVDRREAADNSFVTGEMLESGARIREIAIGEQEKQEGQGSEDELQRTIESQRANEHHEREQT